MTRRSPRSTLFPYSTLLRSHKSQGRRGGPPYFSCSLWLSPHFRRKFCVRIAQERRLATRSTHSTPAFVCFPRIQRESRFDHTGENWMLKLRYRASSRLDFENRAGIHSAADGRAVKRASLAEEHSAGGELVVAELEAENYTLEPDPALLFQRENCTTVRRKSTKLSCAIKCTLRVHRQACPGKAPVTAACEGMKDVQRPGSVIIGWWT